MSAIELFLSRATAPAAPISRPLTDSRPLIDRLFEGGLTLLVVTTFAAVCACMTHL